MIVVDRGEVLIAGRTVDMAELLWPVEGSA
jgi:hypothetical protein